MSPDSARYAQDRGQEPSTSPKAQSKAGAAGAPRGREGEFAGQPCGLQAEFAPHTHEMGSGSPESLRSLKIQWLVPSPVLLDAGQGLLLSCSPPPPGQHLGGSTAAPHPRGFQRQVGWGGSTAAPTPGGSDGRWAGAQLPSVTQDEAQRRCNLPTRRLQRRRYDTLTRKPKEHCF